MNLAEKLINLRRKENLTQLELAEEVGVSRQAVSRWEMGEVLPSTENLRCLGELYHVSFDYLLDDSATEPEAAAPKEASRSRSWKWLVLLLIVALLLAAFWSVRYFYRANEDEGKPVPIGELEQEKIAPEDEEDGFSIEGW